MQAIIKGKAALGLELAEVPKPIPGHRDVLVKVMKTGICGTDRHIYEWDAWASGRIKPPMTIGHEFVGMVEEIGDAVQSVVPGNRVSGEGHIGCGRCYCCRTGLSHICDKVDLLGVDINGAFSQYLVLPEKNIWKVDPQICDDQACLFDPFGNAMHTVMAQEISGKQLLVTGCGTIGLMAIGIARVGGADAIIAVDPNPAKLELAKKMGADYVLEKADEKKVKDLTDRGGVDVLLEMCGFPQAIRDGFRCVRNGGEVALLGIPADDITVAWAEQIIFKGITIRGINGRRMFDTWYQCESFLRRQPRLIEPVITHRLKYHEFDKGVKAMQSGDACKVILDWDSAK
jgi:threonine 3-dehydrogenase